MDTETRTCSRCGKTQPVDQFDARFIHKGTRLTCAHCRENHDGIALATPATAQAVQRRLQQEWRDREKRHQREQQLRVERKAAVEARLQQYGDELLAQHVTAQQRNHMLMQAWRIGRRSSESWQEITRHFEALDPPFTIPHVPKRRPDAALKQRLFTAQQGLCYYCHVEMAPLETPYQGPTEYRAAKRAHEALFQETQRAFRTVNQDDPPDAREQTYTCWRGSEEYARFKQLDDAWRPLSRRRANLEHIIPRSRGGDDSAENLALSCSECNIQKSARTPDEFRQMPHDQVSRLIDLCHMQLGDLARAIQYERENLHGFATVCAELRTLHRV